MTGRRLAGIALPMVAALTLWGIPPAGAAIGDITEFSAGITASSEPWGITAGPDGNLWFAENNKDMVARITPSGTVTEFSDGISAGAFPYSITTGPDGNVWFTEGGKGIGRIDPSTGTVTEFTTGIAPGSDPEGITAGPDGNLWFTEYNAHTIGRITPSGTVHEFTTGISSGGEDITAGPDGNLWFTEPNNNTIGRITPSGTVDEFTSGITSGSPQGIAAGPDGALWFVEESGPPLIGRIDTSGVITEFSNGITADSELWGIAAGPDGNLWFPEFNNDKIGRITPSGNVTEFSNGITSGSGPFFISPGTDGNLWFPERDGSRIGRARDAAPGTRYDLVRDDAFTPRTSSATQGNKVEWIFEGPGSHSVQDTSGMNLFHSGVRSFVDYYTFRFNAAGAYAYRSTGDPAAMRGTVKVPEEASPSSGGLSTAFHVTWSALTAPTGYVFDVQIKRPGSTSYVDWKAGVTGRTASFVPDHGKGHYSFRSRLRKKSNGKHSGWSPAATVSVT